MGRTWYNVHVNYKCVGSVSLLVGKKKEKKNEGELDWIYMMHPNIDSERLFLACQDLPGRMYKQSTALDNPIIIHLIIRCCTHTHTHSSCTYTLFVKCRKKVNFIQIYSKSSSTTSDACVPPNHHLNKKKLSNKKDTHTHNTKAKQFFFVRASVRYPIRNPLFPGVKPNPGPEERKKDTHTHIYICTRGREREKKSKIGNVAQSGKW